ncbi:hypothetical protein MNV49_005620 [Pseudohyphozyma bogoriensis]|nr:hypothetical protein MNV49_005620 [Pseudohyphozyma bogoriensis]
MSLQARHLHARGQQRQHAATASISSRDGDSDDDDLRQSALDLSDDQVLLFPSSSATRQQPPPPASQSQWQALPRRPSLSSQYTSASNATSSDAATSSPLSPSHALFPSHDGNGIFVAGSLVLSHQAYSSAESISVGARTSASSHSRSRSSASASSFVHLNRPTRNPSFSSTSSQENDALGGERWSRASALTEEALSTIPDADIAFPISRAHSLSLKRADDDQHSAIFTSEDESDQEAAAATRAWKATPTRGAAARGGVRHSADAYPDSSDDEEYQLYNTPHAASAGLSSTSFRARRRRERERHAYPTPPPELKSKRRHRHNGRAGSQKKSSISSDSAPQRSVATTPVASTVIVPPRVVEREEEETLSFPGGKILSTLFQLPPETIQLFNTPTPTQSRSTTPHPSYSLSYKSRPRSARHSKPHGWHAVARQARLEIDGGDGQYYFADDQDYEMSGDETEVEGERDGERTRRASDAETIGDRSESGGWADKRSRSLTELPLSEVLGLGMSSLRRATSLTGSSLGGSSQNGEAESPWPGEELDGLEAAVSYWRRILRRLTGARSTEVI